MYHDVRELFKSILVLFVKSKHIEEHARRLSSISFALDEHILEDSDIFIGEDTKSLLNGRTDEEKKAFYERVKSFYRKLASDLQRCLPLNNKVLCSLKFLGPDFKGKEDSVCHIAKCLKWDNTDINELVSQWRLFVIDSELEEFRQSHPDDVACFWSEIAMKPKYHKLADIALCSLSVPCGNACVERVFSDLSDILTKKRNKLSEISVDSCLLVTGYLKQTNQTCVTMTISEKMITAGFDAHAKFVARLKENQKKEEIERAEIERQKKFKEQVEAEIERQKKHNKIAQKENEITSKRNSLHESMKATEELIREYQKKMSHSIFDLHKLSHSIFTNLIKKKRNCLRKKKGHKRGCWTLLYQLYWRKLHAL